MNPSRFYGYKHWTLEDPPRCFYVGKGLKKRPFENRKKRRSIKWLAIVSRLGLRVEVCVGPVTNVEACVWEIEQIVLENTFSTCFRHHSSDIGCNFTLGGQGTIGVRPNITNEMRLAASVRRKGREPWNKGLKLSDEERKSRCGRIISEETRAKMRASHLGKTPWNKGQISSEVTKEKIRVARGRQVIKHSVETRKRMSETAKRQHAIKSTPNYENADVDERSTTIDS